jgi:hypothetical protein
VSGRKIGAAWPAKQTRGAFEKLALIPTIMIDYMMNDAICQDLRFSAELRPQLNGLVVYDKLADTKKRVRAQSSVGAKQFHFGHVVNVMNFRVCPLKHQTVAFGMLVLPVNQYPALAEVTFSISRTSIGRRLSDIASPCAASVF